MHVESTWKSIQGKLVNINNDEVSLRFHPVVLRFILFFKGGHLQLANGNASFKPY